jgi:hypothetical protein
MYDAFRWTEIQVGKNHESIIASFISGITRNREVLLLLQIASGEVLGM